MDTILDYLESQLDQQLDCIERNPQGLVILDYQTRMELWHDQIIPDRRGALKREPTTEYGQRMATLLFADYFRLQRRAEKESIEFDGLSMISEILYELVEYRRIIDEIIKNSD